jgi:hypothetical protein
MANTQSQYNPAYSTIKAIYLDDESIPSTTVRLNILRQNTECQFERIEFVENVNDIFPNGVLIVRDTKDIVSRIKQFEISKIYVEFFNSNVWNLDITSVSYLNNAASETEENFVGIYFTNTYYKKAQQTSLNQLLGNKKPSVEFIHDFVARVKSSFFGYSGGYNDITSNYVLYRPINTMDSREEMVSDNALNYLNYLTTNALEYNSRLPTYMFWTEFDGTVNFKAFRYDDKLNSDPSFGNIDNRTTSVVNGIVYTNNRNFGIYDGEAVLQKMTPPAGSGIDPTKLYRKIYFFSTDPAYQFISKNYYYIRKTPKVLDVLPPGLCADNGEKDLRIYSDLSYQYQDEGQKYNIELITTAPGATAIPGSDQLHYTNHWGYYDDLDSMNHVSHLTHIGQVFGTDSAYKNMNLMGSSGYMPYVDNTEMWKNMFDLTPLDPNYPDAGGIIGVNTNLQKVINGRYRSFEKGLCGAQKQLELYRKIELQNFVGYVLCCMGKESGENCFFAALTRYELDSTKGTSGANIYRYRWNELQFSGSSGACGACGAGGACGACGACGGIYFHQIENWKPSGLASSPTQDETWAINLNERGTTGNYLAPGWVPSCLPSGFNYRPIGESSSTFTPGTGGDIYHIAKICKYTDGENVLYYFIAENVVDGCCDTGTP